MPAETIEAKPYSALKVAKVLSVSYLTAKSYHMQCRFVAQRGGHSFMLTEAELQRFVKGKQEVTV